MTEKQNKEKKHIEKLEKVQRAATRWVPSLRNLSYEERLKKLQLPTHTERRERGDMIMLCKCVEGMEKIDVKEWVGGLEQGERRASNERARDGR